MDAAIFKMTPRVGRGIESPYAKWEAPIFREAQKLKAVSESNLVAMTGLKVRFLNQVESSDGEQADLLLIEPNGDEHQVRCLCRIGGSTEIGEVGDGEVLTYLNECYGSQTVWALCRDATLSNGFST